MPASLLTRPSPPGRAARRWVLAATSLGFAVIQLDVSVVNVAVKPIGTALGAGISGLQWVVDAYTVGLAALILSAGALADRVGAKRVFAGGFALFTLASGACGASPSLPALIGARAVQGAAAAVLLPASLSLLHHSFPDHADRSRAVGVWSAGASLALAAGPVVGGVLIAALGWRSIFFINAPLGLLGIALTLRYGTETTRTPGRGIDLPGQALAIAGLAGIAGGVIAGGHGGFGATGALAGLALGALALIAFVVVEARARRPMLPLAIFRSRPFSAATAIGLVLNVAFYGLIFVFSLYFQRARHLSPLHTGLAFVPTMAAVLPANLISGHVHARFGPRRVIAAGALAASAASAGLLAAGGAAPYASLLVPLAVLGFGVGLVVPAMTATALASAAEARAGIAAGILNTARQTGSVIGVAVFGALLSAGSGLVGGLREALVASIALALVAAALGVGIGGRGRAASR